MIVSVDGKDIHVGSFVKVEEENRYGIVTKMDGESVTLIMGNENFSQEEEKKNDGRVW